MKLNITLFALLASASALRIHQFDTSSDEEDKLVLPTLVDNNDVALDKIINQQRQSYTQFASQDKAFL